MNLSGRPARVTCNYLSSGLITPLPPTAKCVKKSLGVAALILSDGAVERPHGSFRVHPTYTIAAMYGTDTADKQNEGLPQVSAPS